MRPTLDEITARFPKPPGRIVLLTEVGSTMHGISVGSDDLDLMGLVIEGPEYVIGLKQWETSVHRTKPEGVRSEPGDIDLTYHSLRKFMRLAVKGNPTILQVFWIPCGAIGGDVVISCDSVLHERMIALRERLISKHAGRAYLGYLVAQRMRLTGERGQKNVNRPELVERFGYDTKFAAHAIRLGLQGIELLRTGKLTLPIPRYQGGEVLRGIRNGQFALPFILEWIAELEESLKFIIQKESVPEEPDRKAVDEFLIDAYLMTWREEGRTPCLKD